MTVRLVSWLALRRPDLLPLIDDEDDTPEEVAADISEAGTVFFPAARYNVVLCVNQMRNARVARQALERLRATAYDASNPGHEQLLVKLWAKTFPSIRLDGRISEQWKDLGFQGTDPATDFRGGGILSLLMMIYTADYHTPVVRTILRDLPPTDMKSWYPYAVASINLTCDLMRRVASGKLDDILYAAPTDPNRWGGPGPAAPRLRCSGASRPPSIREVPREAIRGLPPAMDDPPAPHHGVQHLQGAVLYGPRPLTLRTHPLLPRTRPSAAPDPRMLREPVARPLPPRRSPSPSTIRPWDSR
eukprot:TRINITY_DN4663_c0_g1_i1.p1 TRINITY_DN4663_c0_g1~~TRINITY_DN4663_c0_g1_i1.p1  ORF type:complete len:350 (+),score=79.52 TRINITY_DN4663_c0_g1_i1:147-1052(+)